jgi:hypothetical protein
MNLLQWLKSLRCVEPVTAAEIRRRLHALRQQQSVTVQQRDLLALDAVNDEAAAERWRHLDETVLELDQRMQVLTAALPIAEAREAEAAERTEVERRARAMKAYERATAEAQQFVDATLARLPDGETLTRLRDWRDRLADESRDLRVWSTDVQVRRPLDPLHVVVSAMQHRIARVSRARWMGSAPITLGGTSSETLAEAAARIKRTGA